MKKEKNNFCLGEILILIFGFILILFNLSLLINSYLNFFFLFEGLGSGYLLLFLDFISSSNFFLLVIWTLSLLFLKKIKILFFIVGFYVIGPTLININKFAYFSLFEKFFLAFTLVYFVSSFVYLTYKKIKEKNEKNKKRI